MPRSVPRRTQDALLLSSLTMAVIVGKMFAAGSHVPRARTEIDFTQHVMGGLAGGEMVGEPGDADSTPGHALPLTPQTDGETSDQSLQSKACRPLPRDVNTPDAHQQPLVSPLPPRGDGLR